MREACLLRLVMVLAKVAGGVEELLGDNRRLQANFFTAVKNRVAAHVCLRLLRLDELQRSSSGIQTAISAVEQRAHIGSQHRIRGGLVCGLSLTQRIRGVQVGDPTILGKRADMRTRRVIQKSNKSHSSTKDAVRLTSTRAVEFIDEASVSQTHELLRRRRHRS